MRKETNRAIPRPGSRTADALVDEPETFHFRRVEEIAAIEKNRVEMERLGFIYKSIGRP